MISFSDIEEFPFRDVYTESSKVLWATMKKIPSTKE